jgi:hypothetical protein
MTRPQSGRVTDCDIVGTLVKTVNIGGMLTVQQDVSGTLEISNTRIGDIMVTLAATDGEQDISVNQAAGGTTVIVELPLEGGVTKGVIGTFKVHFVAKSHSTQPTSVDIALLDTEAPDSDAVFPTSGKAGPHTRARAIAKPVSATQFASGAGFEVVVDRSFAARRTFRTKGTSGSLALAYRFNGGTDIVYTMRVQVDGKALAGAL